MAKGNGEMSRKLIIEILDGVSDLQALELIKQVIAQGRISCTGEFKHSGEFKHYCHYTDCYVASKKKTRKGLNSFFVGKAMVK